MEEVVDSIIIEMDALRQEDAFVQVMDVTQEPHLDDPGVVLVDEYPYIYVAPVSDQPRSETMGIAGYDVRVLTVQVGVVVNASDYFNPEVSELPATRELMQASKLIRKRLRRLSKRGLDGLSGVRGLVVQNTNYVPDIRDNVFVRAAVTTIVVERQYANEE